MRAVFSILRKDLTVEGRSRDLIPAMTLVALLLLALGGSAGLRGVEGAVVLWIAVVVSSAIGLTRSFGAEGDQEQLHGLRLSPIDPAWIFLGKAAANAVVVIAVEVAILGAALVFLDLPLGDRPLALAAVLGLGAAAVVSVGTLLGAVLAAARLREAMLPLLLLPLSAPAVMAASGATVKLLAGPEPISGELMLLGAFLTFFVAAGVLMFEFVIEE
jgi:heme exporter protein B